MKGFCNLLRLWLSDRNHRHLMLWTLNALRMFCADRVCEMLWIGTSQKGTLFLFRDYSRLGVSSGKPEASSFKGGG